jgi:hypothetical protein
MNQVSELKKWTISQGKQSQLVSDAHVDYDSELRSYVVQFTLSQRAMWENNITRNGPTDQ